MSKASGRTRSDELSVDYHVESDGSWTARTPLGEVSEDASGRITGIINNVKAIAVGNVTSLRSHQIDESAVAVSHRMTFRNGGYCRLTYRKTGEVIEFGAGNIRLRVNDDNVLTINPFD